MKKIIILLIALITLVGCNSTSSSNKKKTKYLSGNYQIEINVENYGIIKVEVDADSAPITVTNFISLIKDKFYDGLTFHRVIKDFMIQGGDPKGDGTGGSKKTIKGEFSENNYKKNKISHTRGAISMARSSANDSASSQFFIVHKNSTFLDGKYAAFGHVYEGMEVVDAIANNTPATDANGTVAKENQPKIISIRVIKKL